MTEVPVAYCTCMGENKTHITVHGVLIKHEDGTYSREVCPKCGDGRKFATSACNHHWHVT